MADTARRPTRGQGFRDRHVYGAVRRIQHLQRHVNALTGNKDVRREASERNGWSRFKQNVRDRRIGKQFIIQMIRDGQAVRYRLPHLDGICVR